MCENHRYNTVHTIGQVHEVDATDRELFIISCDSHATNNPNTRHDPQLKLAVDRNYQPAFASLNWNMVLMLQSGIILLYFQRYTDLRYCWTKVVLHLCCEFDEES